MVPSAEERAARLLVAYEKALDECYGQHSPSILAGYAEVEIDHAILDGFTAGVQAERQATDRDQINYDEGRRARTAAIIAMLREPSDELVSLLSNGPIDDDGSVTRAALRALADYLSQAAQNDNTSMFCGSGDVVSERTISKSIC